MIQRSLLEMYYIKVSFLFILTIVEPPLEEETEQEVDLTKEEVEEMGIRKSDQPLQSENMEESDTSKTQMKHSNIRRNSIRGKALSVKKSQVIAQTPRRSQSNFHEVNLLLVNIFLFFFSYFCTEKTNRTKSKC